MNHDQSGEMAFIQGAELRAVTNAETKKRTLVGYAAKFGVESILIAGQIREVVLPGAFTKSVAKDVKFLLNHNRERVLARTKSGTLTLREDEVGLRFEADIAGTTYGNDLLTLVDRGDVSEMSFGFFKGKDNWRESTREKNVVIRELLDVDLFEVSIATFPVYPETEVRLRERGLQDWKKQGGVWSPSVEMRDRELRLSGC